MKTWHDKAHELIAAMCMESYRQMNPVSKKRKKHVQYAVPALAQLLVECLNKNDEERAKSIFMNYDIIADEYKR